MLEILTGLAVTRVVEHLSSTQNALSLTLGTGGKIMFSNNLFRK